MKKIKYIKPQIEEIRMDNEISLQLSSQSQPIGPGEGGGFDPNAMAPNRNKVLDVDPYEYEGW